MKPKEKAIELVVKFKHTAYSDYLTTDNEYNNAKQCALIAVDELLTWFKAHSYSDKNYDAFVFYQEVKQEIEKL